MSGAANVHELRDADEARHVLLQSWLLQRLQPPRASAVHAIVDWALDLAGAGVPIPPLGVLADLGHILLMPDASALRDPAQVPQWSDHLALGYEDLVLGKWLATSLERAGDALRQYQQTDRARALTFVYTQIRSRCGFGGLLLSPASLRKLRAQPADQIVATAWDSLERYGLLPLLPLLYDDLEQHVRRTPCMLGREDIFELEQRTALSGFSQRVALRQVLQASATLRASLPVQPPALAHSRREVPSHLRDEDTYPVGGFTSLSNRGTVESLLHSQLAFMEDERPDLFDIKFLRDELLYYSRDDNRFFRRRRDFILLFYPDLVHARVKDRAAPWQRIILLLALTIALIEGLETWLGNDALVFELFFLHAADGSTPLESEQSLLETVLRTQIANQSVRIVSLDEQQVPAYCEQRVRRSLVDCLLLATRATQLNIDLAHVGVGSLHLDHSGPILEWSGSVEKPQGGKDDDSYLEKWSAALATVMNQWMRR